MGTLLLQNVYDWGTWFPQRPKKNQFYDVLLVATLHTGLSSMNAILLLVLVVRLANVLTGMEQKHLDFPIEQANYILPGIR